jgi:putative transposase
VLKEAEAGAKTKELCRRHGISEATFYNWKAKYAGMAVSEGTRTGVWYEKRDRLYIAAPPSGVLGARLLVFDAQTD